MRCGRMHKISDLFSCEKNSRNYCRTDKSNFISSRARHLKGLECPTISWALFFRGGFLVC